MANGRSEFDETFERYLNRTEKVVDGVCADIKNLYHISEEKVKKTIDELVGSSEVRDLGSVVSDNAGKGKAKVQEALKGRYDFYNVRLDELAQDNPRVAGFVDGFVNAYLPNANTHRRPKSEIYNMHVTYGKVVGWGSAYMLFSTRSLLRFVAGSMPVWTRTAKYFNAKVAEAKAAEAASSNPVAGANGKPKRNGKPVSM